MAHGMQTLSGLSMIFQSFGICVTSRSRRNNKVSLHDILPRYTSSLNATNDAINVALDTSQSLQPATLFPSKIAAQLSQNSDKDEATIKTPSAYAALGGIITTVDVQG
jgi:hypothetical protein